eukprot:872171_1
MTATERDESFDTQEACQLFKDMYGEEKEFTMDVEGDIALPTISNSKRTKTAKYQRTRTASDYDTPCSRNRSVPQSHNNPGDSTALPLKAYCVAGYQILLHLSILYCIAAVTYLLITNSNQYCECTQIITEPEVHPVYNNSTVACDCSSMITDAPSLASTQAPSMKPTSHPTATPTLQPTQRIESDIGDYKMSAKKQIAWLLKLCDGSFLDSNDFPELFEIIAHSFGSFDGYPALFALPNARNNVLGMKSDTSAIGSQIGSDTITLNEAHLPSHYHLLIGASGCRGYNSLTANNYLSIDCNFQNDDNFHIAAASSTSATKGRSSTVGNNEPINVHQPTLFVGNLFIYAGKS